MKRVIHWQVYTLQQSGTIRETTTEHECTIFTCLSLLCCVVDSWLSEVEQTTDGHCSQLGWRTSPRKEVGGFRLLLRQRYCSGHLGAAKVSFTHHFITSLVGFSADMISCNVQTRRSDQCRHFRFETFCGSSPCMDRGWLVFYLPLFLQRSFTAPTCFVCTWQCCLLMIQT